MASFLSSDSVPMQLRPYNKLGARESQDGDASASSPIFEIVKN